MDRESCRGFPCRAIADRRSSGTTPAAVAAAATDAGSAFSISSITHFSLSSTSSVRSRSLDSSLVSQAIDGQGTRTPCQQHAAGEQFFRRLRRSPSLSPSQSHSVISVPQPQSHALSSRTIVHFFPRTSPPRLEVMDCWPSAACVRSKKRQTLHSLLLHRHFGPKSRGRTV